MGALYGDRLARPLVCVSLALFSTLSQIARIVGILNQTRGEEFASVLESGRITNEIPKALVDLYRPTQLTTIRVEQI